MAVTVSRPHDEDSIIPYDLKMHVKIIKFRVLFCWFQLKMKMEVAASGNSPQVLVSPVGAHLNTQWSRHFGVVRVELSSPFSPLNFLKCSVLYRVLKRRRSRPSAWYQKLACEALSSDFLIFWTQYGEPLCYSIHSYGRGKWTLTWHRWRGCRFDAVLSVGRRMQKGSCFLMCPSLCMTSQPVCALAR